MENINTGTTYGVKLANSQLYYNMLVGIARLEQYLSEGYRFNQLPIEVWVSYQNLIDTLQEHTIHLVEADKSKLFQMDFHYTNNTQREQVLYMLSNYIEGTDYMLVRDATHEITDYINSKVETTEYMEIKDKVNKRVFTLLYE